MIIEGPAGTLTALPLASCAVGGPGVAGTRKGVRTASVAEPLGLDIGLAIAGLVIL